jgi:hypothetical protein
MTIESSQKKLLEKILNSSEFLHSKIYQTYLKYLVDAADQRKELKETTIAIEVFGKDSSFNPAEDTIVRSHTYTLRKKLESYYFQEGKEDKYRLRIPKGHYEIQFISALEETYHPKKLIFTVARSYPQWIIFALCGVIGFLWFHERSVEKKLKNYQCYDQNDAIWKDYLQSELPILLVIGNHFFFDDYSEKYRQTISIRNPRVNSIEDFIDQYPDLHLTPSPEPYFPYHSIWSLPPILSMLFSVNKTPVLRKASDLSPQILDEYNIIYLGSIKSLYNLKHTLSKSHFQYQILPHRIKYTPPDTGSVKTFETSLHSEGPNEDLVLALKLPGPVNNSIFIIASYHSLGAPEIVHYLTNLKQRNELIEKFKNKYDDFPPFFEILFRVSGIDKTAYNVEMLVFNEININQK